MVRKKQYPEPGQAAPSFELPSTGGGSVSLRDLHGQWVVLFFFPKAGTPG